jgi:uncharacterized membrane protein
MTDRPPPRLMPDGRPAHRPDGPVDSLPPTGARWAFRILLAGFVAAAGLEVAGLFPAAPGRWLELAVPVLAAGAALANLATRLPLQNVTAVALLVFLFSSALLACTTACGIPFGSLWFTDESGPRLLGKLPWAMPCWWVAILVSSRETARLLLRRWHRRRNYGLLLAGLAALLAVVTDLGREPYGAVVKCQWLWTSPARLACWYTAPWTNFVGWLVSGAVILGLCTPWFISKQPVRPRPSLESAELWAFLNLGFLAGNARHGLWAAVVLGGVLTGAVGLLTWCGLKFGAEPPRAKPQP